MSRLGLSPTVLVDETFVGDALGALESLDSARETEGTMVRARAARSASERAVVASMASESAARRAGRRRRADARRERWMDGPRASN